MSFYLKPVELSPPKSMSGTTSSTAGEPSEVSIKGNVYEVTIVNKSIDYSLYASFDFGDTYIEIPPDTCISIVFGSFPDPTILLKSDGVSQEYEVIYRLRL